MITALVVGSGAAAAGAALALTSRPDVQVTVVDVGLRLEPERQRVVRRLGQLDAATWPDADVDRIAGLPVPSGMGGLPEKRTYGSDYPFRDAGQLRGVHPGANVNGSLISGAYGGFSNVWGAQVLPFPPAVLDRWGLPFATLEPHYRAVLEHIPFAGGDDELSELFPLIAAPAPLPPLSRRSELTLAAYDRHRSAIRSMGIRMGGARLALDAPSCELTGLCMTGCPYELIYSAAQTFDRLQRNDRVRYLGDLLAVRVGDVADADGEGSRGYVSARDLRSGELHRLEADHVFVACGAMGSTRLVASSLDLGGTEVHLQESQQVTVPMLSLRGTPDPRREARFTLNQFNLTLDLDDRGYEVAQVHYYTYNDAFLEALPGPLRRRVAARVTGELLKRLSVAIAYLPSWHSPALRLRFGGTPAADALREIQVEAGEPPPTRAAFLRTLLRRALRVAPLLDLYPILPRAMLAAAGKSYHWGGSFPYAAEPRGPLTTDRLGRVAAWKRVHLVDASVFPSIPATTYMLTVMANAHRIAAESLAAAA